MTLSCTCFLVPHLIGSLGAVSMAVPLCSALSLEPMEGRSTPSDPSSSAAFTSVGAAWEDEGPAPAPEAVLR